MIRLDDIWKTFERPGVPRGAPRSARNEGRRPALRGVTLHVDEGEAVLLTGPSGAGKTTLLRLICLAERPDRGKLAVAGKALGKLRSSAVPYVRRNIGMVFQDPVLMHDRTVVDNVAVSVEVLGLRRSEVAARARTALEAVGLTPEAERRVRGLPAGVQQRVAMARALCGDPAILLCDEPTSGLDPIHTRDLLELLEGVRGRGTTIVIATHDPTVVAFGMAHGWRKAVLQQGQLLSGGLPAHEMLAQAEEAAGITVAISDASPVADLAISAASPVPDPGALAVPLPASVFSEATARIPRDSLDSGPVAVPLRVVPSEHSIEVSIEIELSAPHERERIA